jgi:AcrR family transcriptional regulator
MCAMSPAVRRGRRKSVTPEEILAVAKTHAVRDGWRAARVQAIAAEVGISRPTLYKEFPSKRELGIALVQDENARIIAQMREAIVGAKDIGEGLERGIRFALAEAVDNPLLAMVLREDGSGEHSLMATISAGPDTIVPLAVAVTTELLALGRPDLPTERLAFVGDTVVRLTFSHALLPGGLTHDELARQIASLGMAMLDAQFDAQFDAH